MRSDRADQEMDFCVGIFNTGIRSRDIVIGGVVPEFDQIIGSAGRLSYRWNRTDVVSEPGSLPITDAGPVLGLVGSKFQTQGSTRNPGVQNCPILTQAIFTPARTSTIAHTPGPLLSAFPRPRALPLRLSPRHSPYRR